MILSISDILYLHKFAKFSHHMVIYNLRDNFNFTDLIQGSNYLIEHIVKQLIGDRQRLMLHLQN